MSDGGGLTKFLWNGGTPQEKTLSSVMETVKTMNFEL